MWESQQQNVTSPILPSQFLPSGSSTDDTERKELSILYLFTEISKKIKGILYESIEDLVEIDISSVAPRFKIRNVISFKEEISEKLIYGEGIEEAIFIHLPPKRRYTINLEIKSRKKATPKIIDLEWI